jgi:hypothetical protein
LDIRKAQQVNTSTPWFERDTSFDIPGCRGGISSGSRQRVKCQAINVLVRKGYLTKDEESSRRNIKLISQAMEKLAARDGENRQQLELKL